MTIVEGQIESLKKLREILNQNGITRFNSTGDINNFLKNYESEKDEIKQQIEYALDQEIQNLKSDRKINDELVADGDPVILGKGDTGYVKAGRIHDAKNLQDCKLVYVHDKASGLTAA
jgi:hypothetical protein